MRIEIFVVTTKIEEGTGGIVKRTQLENLKTQSVREFGGLTETGTERGYWNDHGTIFLDKVERWIIYTDLRNARSKIAAIAKQIKIVTRQESQAFGINGKLFSV